MKSAYLSKRSLSVHVNLEYKLGYMKNTFINFIENVLFIEEFPSKDTGLGYYTGFWWWS